MELTQIQEEFLQWQKDNGKTKYGLVDVLVNNNSEIKEEQRMGWTITFLPDDWRDFCKATNKEYEEVKLLFRYIIK